MQTYSIMGYDAIAVSSSDLTAGQVFLKKTNVPWVSSNILDDSGKLLFDPFIIKKVGDLKVGVIGLTGPGNYKNDKIIISDWRESFPRQVADLKSRTDMVVLLSNFPSSENEEIARKYPELNVILTADNRQGNRPPHLAGSALITQTQSRGKYLGKLLIQFSPERKWSDDTRRTTPVTNFYKADFIPIRPSAPQPQEVNLMVKELKQKKRQLKKR